MNENIDETLFVSPGEEVEEVIDDVLAEEAPDDVHLVLRTDNLVKKYRTRTVVNHVSINVKQGEIVGLLGRPSSPTISPCFTLMDTWFTTVRVRYFFTRLSVRRTKWTSSGASSARTSSMTSSTSSPGETNNVSSIFSFIVRAKFFAKIRKK